MLGAKIDTPQAAVIAAIALRSVCALPALAQQTPTFNDDFQSGSYWSIDHDANNTASTTDDIITIEPVRWSVITPENAGSSNPPQTVFNDHWWWAFETGNIGGLTPTFQINTSQAWFGNYGSSYSPIFRYVGAQGAAGDWQFFDNTSQSFSTFSFSNNAAFDAALGNVQVSYALPYTPDIASAHTASLANHARVSQTASALFTNPTAQQFGVIGQTPTGHTDLIRSNRPGNAGTVAVNTAQYLLAFTVTDSLVEDAGKQQIVLMSGNHAAEHTGNFALQGMVDFLTSGHPIAELLLDHAEFHVYPIVDPEGRALGQTRGNDSALGFGQTPAFIDSGTGTGTGSEHIRIIDHNRVWDRDGIAQPYDEVATIRDAIIRDTSNDPGAPNPTTDIDYFFDFHGFPAGGGGDNTPFEIFESGSNATVISALRSLTGMNAGDIIDGASGAHPGISERWAFLQGGELDAEHAFTPEIGVAHQSALLQTPQDVEQLYLDHGEDYARALAAVLLPINTVVYNEVSPRDWDSAAWQTLTEQASPIPNGSSHVLIAATTDAALFTGPSTNTTLSAFTVFGYDNTPNTQPLQFNLQQNADLTITGQLHIENATVGPATPNGPMGTLTAGTILLIGYEHDAILESSSTLTAMRIDLLGNNAQLRITGGSAATHHIDLLNSEGGHLFAIAGFEADTLVLDASSRLTHSAEATIESSIIADIAGTLTIAGDGNAVLGDTATLLSAALLIGTFGQVEDALFADNTLGWSLSYLIDSPGDDLLTATVRYAGDANGDDFIGIQDLDILLANWNAPGSTVTAGVFGQGDFTGDGQVNNADLQLVLSNWSVGTAPDPSIPEPATVLMLGIGLLTLSRRARRL